MKKSEEKRQLVEELTSLYQNLNVELLFRFPNRKETKDWLSGVGAILKNLDEGDFQRFESFRQHIYGSIERPIRKHAAEQIDGFISQKVAEYRRYDFSYLDREIKDNPEDISNYVHDKELRDRCLDLLKAESKYDRVINQATQVLEDRIRTKANLIERLQGVGLINKVLNPDPDKTILKISDDSDEQQGFCDICRGLMLTFRNPTHHYLSDQITREEAFKVCVFIDTLLPIIEKSSISTPTLKPKEETKRDGRTTKPNSNIRVSLQNGIASWANYSTSHSVWSSFRISFEIDNYNSSRPDYISVSLIADLSSGGEWVAKHFIFQGIDKQDEEFRIEANEIKKVSVFISDHPSGNAEQIPIPEIDKRTLKLEITTRSDEKFLIPIEEDKIIKG